ncbi:hypothetical protein SAMN05216203_0425 [Marinobacter daqiaonensis]|uniref:Uncharacterized protein n=1 Tax=Marinobacter daqiaonensis TaxID=650891 RepID=A0A1I6GS98_9GAMM|nr:hypothetical protein [Marinobacter daqiaonensis]SFR45060.1 hypothetical protein SAMN05216203_0425 [Marinobacter daqiaonensis]
MRGLLVLLLIVGLVALMTLGPRWLGRDGEVAGSSSELPGEGDESPCHPLSETCTWPLADGPASVSMKPLEQNELSLELKLPDNPDRVVMILLGVSMYMGEYPVGMQKQQAGRYHATFVPPFCTTGPEMVWQVTFEVDGRRLDTGPGLVFSPSEAFES